MRFEHTCKELGLPTVTDINEAKTSQKALKIPSKREGVNEELWFILKAQYMQSILGDADAKSPKEFFGLNGKKKREWESWNNLRGVSKDQARVMLVNTAID